MTTPEPQKQPIIESTPSAMDGDRRPQRRWPWIVGTALGFVVGLIAWFVTGFIAWFGSGGTFGGLGASASDSVDWGRLQEAGARLTPIPVLTAGAVPLAWSWKARRRPGGERTRAGTWRVVAVISVLLALSLGPLVSLHLDRARAIEPDPAVIEALRRVSSGPLERTVERPYEDRPWVVVYRTPSLVDLDAVTAATSAGGEWLCWERSDSSRMFRSDGVTVLARHEGRVEVHPAVHPPDGSLRAEHCS